MSAPTPVAVKCPRCGESVDVGVSMRPIFVHENDGSSYVTARVSASKTEHACTTSARAIGGL